MAAILQPDYNRRMNVTRQPLRSISLVVYKGVQMLDVAGPQYEDADLTNEPIAQRCGFGEPDTLRRAFLRHFGVAPRSIGVAFIPVIR
jgi:AraC-like DNA-binding protein